MLATGSGGDVMSHDPPKRTFSIELFPPRTPKGEAGLNSALTELGELQPAYFSVTFGAGGTTRSGTYETVRTAATVTGRPVARSEERRVGKEWRARGAAEHETG